MSRRRSNKRGRFRPGHAADNGRKAGSSSESKSESKSTSNSGSGSSH
jgi:hypothetical protein